LSVYAGCAAERVPEVIDLTLAEFAELRRVPVPADELRRAKDHLKGSLMRCKASRRSPPTTFNARRLISSRKARRSPRSSGLDCRPTCRSIACEADA
jgi:hypothetical protein